jgi:hypothetical protein
MPTALHEMTHRFLADPRHRDGYLSRWAPLITVGADRQYPKRWRDQHRHRDACAQAASARLRVARLVIAGSLLLFVAAIGTWRWAPPAPAQPPALISISTPSGIVCGTLISDDDGVFTVQPPNTSGQVRVLTATATNVQVVASC